MEPDTRMKEIDALEHRIAELRQQLAELKREYARQEVQDHELLGTGGAELRLSDLFGEKRELIVVHNMGKSCAYCTLWADGLNGVLPHLQDRAAFAVVSPDLPEVQAEFAASRGWGFRMASSAGCEFTKAMGFEAEHEGKRMLMPGYSTFTSTGDGKILRTGLDYFGPGDPYCAVWHMFDLLEPGEAPWHPKLSY